MRTILPFLFSLWFSINAFAQDFVDEFYQIRSKKEEVNYIQKYQSGSINQQAFVISLEMKKAEYAWQPWKKMNIFTKQKKRLEELIGAHPNNVYLRFVRLLIQKKTPAIVGYNSNIDEDKAFISHYLEKNEEHELESYFKKEES